MMLLVTLALIADGATPRQTMPTIGQPPQQCIRTEQRVAQTEPSGGPRKLNELPDAEPQFAVVRNIDGCNVPAKVSRQTTRR